MICIKKQIYFALGICVFVGVLTSQLFASVRKSIDNGQNMRDIVVRNSSETLVICKGNGNGGGDFLARLQPNTQETWRLNTKGCSSSTPCTLSCRLGNKSDTVTETLQHESDFSAIYVIRAQVSDAERNRASEGNLDYTPRGESLEIVKQNH